MVILSALQSARARLVGNATVETPRWGVFPLEDTAPPEDAAAPRLYEADGQTAATPVLATARFAIAGASVTATALLAHVTGLTRTQILARPDTTLTDEQATAFEALVERAAQGEPLGYLTGQREFYGLEFEVDRHVLVPRPETERLVDLALARRPQRVLEVGTGSGCIAIALAVHRPQATVTATDLSAEALVLARRNAARHGVAGRIQFIQSDLLSAFRPLTTHLSLSTSAFQPPASSFPPPSYDLIAANLPYIDSDELRGLLVARFEPGVALDGGPGGLRLIERLLSQAPAVLAGGGCLLLEIGATQGQPAADLACAAFPGARVSVERDLAGLDRVLVIETSPGTA